MNRLHDMAIERLGEYREKLRAQGILRDTPEAKEADKKARAEVKARKKAEKEWRSKLL